MRISSFVFLLVAVYTAIAQVGSGTVVIVNFTKDKLIVAADSRASDPSGHRPPDDTHCKLSALGKKIVFTTTGAAFRLPNGPSDLGWTNSEIANTAFRLTPSANGRIRQVADRWGETVKRNWDGLYSRSPSAVARLADPNNGIITTGLFAGVEDGSFIAVPIAITFSALRLQPVQVESAELSDCTGTPPVRICAIGETAVFDELKTGTSPWTREEIVSVPKDAKIDPETLRAIRLVDLTAIHEKKNTVGGPIDALELWKDGSIRWIQRKPNCPAEQ